MSESILHWEVKVTGMVRHEEATLGNYNAEDGVSFSLRCLPTNYRRGTYLLLIDVSSHDHKWEPFDETDQPMRYFHNRACAYIEAQAIATQLYLDRYKKDEKMSGEVR